MSIPDIAERVSVDGSRPASRSAASSSANLATAPSGLVDERLNSSAYFAAIRNARGLPWLPVIRFGRPPLRPGSVPGLGRNSESCDREVLADERPAVGLVPQAVQDLEGLLEHLGTFGDLREREAVAAVLVVVPARADAHLDPPAAHLVDGQHDLGEVAGHAGR